MQINMIHLQLISNYNYIRIAISKTIAIVLLFYRFANKSSVYTQLSSCQLTARHIGSRRGHQCAVHAW